MPQTFDPYHRWLGISPKHRPPDHYRLLGVEQFENDPEVIRDAAARQMAHVRSYQLGQNSELSQKILNELGVAKACLLDPAKKAQYDARLRSRFVADEPQRVASPAQERPSESHGLDFLTSEGRTATTQREPAMGRVKVRKKAALAVNAKRWLILGGAGISTVLLAVLVWAVIPGRREGDLEKEPVPVAKDEGTKRPVEPGQTKDPISTPGKHEPPPASKTGAGTSHRAAPAPIVGGFVASSGSHVFHRPDCKSAAKILEKNLVHYASREEAIQAGKKPCKECRP